MNRKKTNGNGVRLAAMVAVVSVFAIVTGYFLGNFLVGFLYEGKQKNADVGSVSTTENHDKQVDAGSEKGNNNIVSEADGKQAAEAGESTAAQQKPVSGKGTAVTKPAPNGSSTIGSQTGEGAEYLQVASATKEDFANLEVKKLENLGYTALVRLGKDGKYKVLVQVNSTNKAQVIKALESSGYSGVFTPRL